MNNQFQINLIKDKLSIEDLKKLATQNYGEMIKGVVDIKQSLVALGGEMHADAEQFLFEQGSKQQDIWGFNLYPFEDNSNNLIEYHSFINIRPNQQNRSMDIELQDVREKVRTIIFNLIVLND